MEIDLAETSELEFKNLCKRILSTYKYKIRDNRVKEPEFDIILDDHNTILVKMLLNPDCVLEKVGFENVALKSAMRGDLFSIVITNVVYDGTKIIDYGGQYVMIIDYYDLCLCNEIDIVFKPYSKIKEDVFQSKVKFDTINHPSTIEAYAQDAEAAIIVVFYCAMAMAIISLLEKDGIINEWNTLFIFAGSMMMAWPVYVLFKSSMFRYRIDNNEPFRTMRSINLLFLPLTRKDSRYFECSVRGIAEKRHKFYEKFDEDSIKDHIDLSKHSLEITLDDFDNTYKKVTDTSVLSGLIFTTSICLLLASMFNDYLIPIVLFVTIPSAFSCVVGACANIRTLYYFKVDDDSRDELYLASRIRLFNLINLRHQNRIQSNLKICYKNIMVPFYVTSIIVEMFIVVVVVLL